MIAPEAPYPVDRVEDRTVTVAEVNRIIAEMLPNTVGYVPLETGDGDGVSKEIYAKQVESCMRGYAHREADGSITYLPWDNQEYTLREAADNYQNASSQAERFLPGNQLPEDISFHENAYVSYGFVVEFNRSGDYPACSFVDYSTLSSLRFPDDSAYNTPIGFPEICTVYVTENGVETFSWDRPETVAERLNENVDLLPFDEIAARTVRYIRLGHAHYDTKCRFQVSIDKATLTATPQRLKDGAGVVLMPVWVMHAILQQLNEYGNPIVSNDNDVMRHIIVINAVDGTRARMPWDAEWG